MQSQLHDDMDGVYSAVQFTRRLRCELTDRQLAFFPNEKTRMSTRSTWCKAGLTLPDRDYYLKMTSSLSTAVSYTWIM